MGSFRSFWIAALAAGVLAASPRASAGPGLGGQRPDGITLVDGGRPAAAIAIPRGGDPFNRRAAEILQDGIRRMSGGLLPILEKDTPAPSGEVAIGFPADAVPAEVPAPPRRGDGFVVATSGGSLYVRSEWHKGAIYGVVHLLEQHFGCRRFAPGVALFPQRRTIALGAVRDLDHPANQIRIVNGDFSKDADLRDWLRLDATDEVFGRGYYVHTFNRLVPWEKHFAEHPEYFSWMNGKRIKDQLCLSHPDVLKLAIETLGAEIAAQPDRDVWSVSQNDNFSYCQCPDCRKVIEEEGSPAGPIIRFVNQVAARFPDRIISTLAYQYSRQAPKLVKPAANVQIMLCTIELNRSLPIEEDPSSRQFLQDIVDWGKISRNIYLWDYTVNFNHHVSPFPNLHVLQPNIRFFVRNGARQHFQQSNTGAGHEFSELKQYLLARLLWNPEVDADAVMKEFLDGYYGEAGPWIAKYITGLRAALTGSGARLDIYEPPAGHAEDYLSGGQVALYNGWLDRAEAAVQADPSVLERVKTARLPVQYAMLEIAKSDLFGPRGFYEQAGGRFAPRPDMTQLLEDFFQVCSRNGVRTLNESGLTPKQVLRRRPPVHRRAGRGEQGLPQAGRGRAATVAEVLAREPRHPDRRRARRERLQGPVARMGRAGFRSRARPWRICIRERGVGQHPLGRAQLDPAPAQRDVPRVDGRHPLPGDSDAASGWRPARRGCDADVHVHLGAGRHPVHQAPR